MILTGVGPELNLVLVGRILLVRVGRILLVRVGRVLVVRVGRTELVKPIKCIQVITLKKND